VAQELNRRAAAKPPEVKPACCIGRGFYWDDAILYAAHVQWRDEPSPAFLNGPVVHIIPALDIALRDIKL
jgi:hypothetical protein